MLDTISSKTSGSTEDNQRSTQGAGEKQIGDPRDARAGWSTKKEWGQIYF
jgi:hypothetical protein